MICTDIGYPDRDFERRVLTDRRTGDPIDQLRPVLDVKTLRELRVQVRDVAIEESLNDYLLDIVDATRNHEELHLGVSTRGALTLFRAVQATAFLEGRTFAVPDDVKRLAEPVLAHRVMCRGLFREGHRDRARQIIRQIVNETPVPA
jgi:MoxR-like ATPase